MPINAEVLKKNQSSWVPYLEYWLDKMKTNGYEVRQVKKSQQPLKSHPIVSEVKKIAGAKVFAFSQPYGL